MFPSCKGNDETQKITLGLANMTTLKENIGGELQNIENLGTMANKSVIVVIRSLLQT